MKTILSSLNKSKNYNHIDLKCGDFIKLTKDTRHWLVLDFNPYKNKIWILNKKRKKIVKFSKIERVTLYKGNFC